ncbi:hypothetical protein [Actinomadura sp. NTSP31]|uniref:hypothetical protein n=1 Tax=Actinomadura sp. NTSP31 TaxID=1735447 RepID=UPI0035BED15A
MPTTETVAEPPAPVRGHRRRTPPTSRDRDAEMIRAVLRKSGHPEFSRPGDGFYVDGGYDGTPFLVSCACRTRPRRLSPAAEVASYITTLTAAGMHVEPQTGPDASPLVLQVRPGIPDLA